MKKIFFTAFIIFSFGTGYAQNATNSLKLIIDKNKQLAIRIIDASVDVEGYDGDALIIEAVTNKTLNSIPAEAAGLTPIALNNRPAEDNVIGYKVTAETNTLYQITITTKCKYLHIKVPNNLYLFYINALNRQSGSYLSLNNIEGPLEVEGYIQKISLSHTAGPFKITGRAEKVLLANILWTTDAVWPFKQSGHFIEPYLISVPSDIDISVPEKLEASLSLRSGYGQIYSDLNQHADNNNAALNMLTLNGGGVSIVADSHNGNIYLRKQK